MSSPGKLNSRVEVTSSGQEWQRTDELYAGKPIIESDLGFSPQYADLCRPTTSSKSNAIGISNSSTASSPQVGNLKSNNTSPIRAMYRPTNLNKQTKEVTMGNRDKSPHNVFSSANKTTASNKSDLNIVSLNIQGLEKSIDDLQILIESQTKIIDAICIAEHWLKDEELGGATLKKFKPAVGYCRKIGRRGGVCIYVNNRHDFKIINYTTACSVEKQFECIGIELPTLKTILVAVYRTPDSDEKIFLSRLEMTLEKLYKESHSIFICGDINIDFMKESKGKSNLVSLIETFNMKALIHSPTRITETSKTAIDNIFTNVLSEKCLIETNMVHFSDHSVIFISAPKSNRSTIREKQIKKKGRIYSGENIMHFKHLLQLETWDAVYNTQDVEDKAMNFIKTFCKYFNEALPLKYNTIKKKCSSWVTPGIVRSSHTMDELYKLRKQNPTDANISKHKEYKRVFQKVKRAAKKMHFKNEIHKSRNKAKTAWRIIGEESGKTVSHETNIRLKHNDKLVNDPLQVANIFNENFINVGQNTLVSGIDKKVDFIDKLNNVVTNPESKLLLEPTNSNEIWEIIKNMKGTTSTDIYGLSAKVVKSVAEFIVRPLTDICNRSLESGVFPKWFKFSKTIPIYKKGDKSMSTNYRPISLLPIFSKILEKVVYNRLIRYLEQNNIILNNQNGFRKGKSTLTAAFSLTEEILQALDKKEKVLGFFFDLSKAFDTVNHITLLKKLDYYGIRGIPHEWFKSYLNDRQQCVEIVAVNECSNIMETIQSNHLTIKTGVPQGSILGPIMFLILINDLPANVSDGVTVQFADDISEILARLNLDNLEETANNMLTENTQWFGANELQLNRGKTKMLHFHAGKTEPLGLAIYCEGIPNPRDSNMGRLNLSDSTEFLGLHLDDKLNWEQHIVNLISKLSSACFLLRRINMIVDESTCRSIYFSYFHSLMSYGIALWGNSPARQKVFVMQKKAVRIVAQAKYRDSCKPLFKKLKILTMPCVYIFEVILFVHNNLHLFNTNSSVHSVNTRNKNKLCITQCNLALRQRGLGYMGVKLYNHLPENLKTIRDIKQFKCKFKDLLINKCYYSVEEYLECS